MDFHSFDNGFKQQYTYKVSKGAKIRNRYNQVPHLTQDARGVPAYTQSTQLRTLIFECQKNKNLLNRKNAIKNMPHPV